MIRPGMIVTLRDDELYVVLYEVLAVGQCEWDNCPRGDDAVWLERVRDGQRICAHRELVAIAEGRPPHDWEVSAWFAGWKIPTEGVYIRETDHGLEVFDL